MNLNDLLEMSHRYGADEDFVLAGGGNTSYKENNILYVKSSGVGLADILPEQFVAMDIKLLLDMIEREFPASMSNAKREETVLAEMMAARLPGEEKKRPSVESSLHAMFPYKFVLHVHPPLINGLTCGVNDLLNGLKASASDTNFITCSFVQKRTNESSPPEYNALSFDAIAVDKISS